MIDLSFTFKRKEVHDLVTEIRQWKNLDFPDFIRYQARIAVKDLMKWTPPRGPSPGKEPFTSQLERGKKTILRDWHRTFRGLDALKEYRTPHGRFSTDFIRAVDAHDAPRVEVLLRLLGFTNVRGILTVPSKSIHEQARGFGGAVKVSQGWWVYRNADIDAAAKESFPDIGKAKSGWGYAADKLGLPDRHWPAWVKRHGKNGYMQDFLDDPDRPRIVLINDRKELKDTDTGKLVSDVSRILNTKMQLELKNILQWVEWKGGHKRPWRYNINTDDL